MPRALLLSVRFHDGRYHGAGPWPPSPARLFQALVAAAAHGEKIPQVARDAFTWLEGQGAPIVAAPPARRGQTFENFVPNNDLDAVGGDLDRIAKIRAAKRIRPYLFAPDARLLYLWQFEGEQAHARVIADLANRLYQLGRGIDMAFATGEIVDPDAAEACLADYAGTIYRPFESGGGFALACPQERSLQSLIDRHNASRNRFGVTSEPAPTEKDPNKTKVVGQTFTQAPKPRFRQVAYNSPPVWLLFELRTTDADAGFFAWPLSEIVHLVETVRDGAAETLRQALPEKADCVERVFIGRDATEADKASRIRIIPLPSIGHVHAERSIRRLLVEVPPNCPMDARDIAWAFTTWTPHDRETGELSGWQLVEIGAHSGERYLKMPGHYGIGSADTFRRWRTVTPAVLPERAARRRIDPARISDEAKSGSERLAEESRAAAAVCHALRHVGIATPVEDVRVQREPFEGKGIRAELFAHGTRFSSHALWHVELTFVAPLPGPVVIGNGRYLGLGIMAPIKVSPAMHAFTTRSAIDPDLARALARALRRAVMGRVGDVLDTSPHGGLPLFFSGHEADGAPAATERHQHLFFTIEPGQAGRLFVLAPHRVMRDTLGEREAGHLRTLDTALTGLRRLVAGRLGILDLSPLPEPRCGDPLIGPARSWESRTPYRPTRHASRGRDMAEAVVQNVILECTRRGLPRPSVDLLDLAAGPKGGNLAARLRLRFAVAIEGPLLLGHDSHLGGGLFAAVQETGETTAG